MVPPQRCGPEIEQQVEEMKSREFTRSKSLGNMRSGRMILSGDTLGQVNSKSRELTRSKSHGYMRSGRMTQREVTHGQVTSKTIQVPQQRCSEGAAIQQRPGALTSATPTGLCMCQSICFQPVFGDENLCDFCDADGNECECAGEDTGLHRLCCQGSSNGDTDDDTSEDELEEYDRCAVCGEDARNMVGDTLSCPQCDQLLCADHYPPQTHYPCHNLWLTHIPRPYSPPSPPPSPPSPPSSPSPPPASPSGSASSQRWLVLSEAHDEQPGGDGREAHHGQQSDAMETSLTASFICNQGAYVCIAVLALVTAVILHLVCAVATAQLILWTVTEGGVLSNSFAGTFMTLHQWSAHAHILNSQLNATVGAANVSLPASPSQAALLYRLMSTYECGGVQAYPQSGQSALLYRSLSTYECGGVQAYLQSDPQSAQDNLWQSSQVQGRGNEQRWGDKPTPAAFHVSIKEWNKLCRCTQGNGPPPGSRLPPPLSQRAVVTAAGSAYASHEAAATAMPQLLATDVTAAGLAYASHEAAATAMPQLLATDRARHEHTAASAHTNAAATTALSGTASPASPTDSDAAANAEATVTAVSASTATSVSTSSSTTHDPRAADVATLLAGIETETNAELLAGIEAEMNAENGSPPLQKSPTPDAGVHACGGNQTVSWASERTPAHLLSNGMSAENRSTPSSSTPLGDEVNAYLGHDQNIMTIEQQAISVAFDRIQVVQTEAEVCKVARALALALGSTRVEMATTKALHAVLLQMTRPGMTDWQAYTSTAASKANFVQWKRKVLKHERGLPLAYATYQVSTTGTSVDQAADVDLNLIRSISAPTCHAMPLMETVLGTRQQRSDVHDLEVSTGPIPEPTPVSLPVSATTLLGPYANADGCTRVQVSQSTQQTAFANQRPVAFAVPLATALGSNGSQLLPLAEASPSFTLPLQPAAPDHSDLSFQAQRALQAALDEGLSLERNMFASGYHGVTYNSNNGHGNLKAKPFTARLRLTDNKRRRVSRGSFATAEEAALHYARLLRDESNTYMAA